MPQCDGSAQVSVAVEAERKSFLNLRAGLLRPWLNGPAARRLLARYRRVSPGVRLELGLRLRICPFEEVARLVPPEGSVLDLGCGYGLLSLLLVGESNRREVVGIDLQEERVRIAREAARPGESVRFFQGDILEVPFGNPTCIVMNDVLHHIPHTRQIPLLCKCYESLPPGGLLIIKDVDKVTAWKYIWNYVHDFIRNRNLPFYCLDTPILLALLEMIGFQIEITRLDAGYPYPHVLYLCRKPS